MTRRNLSVGSSANDGTGDTLRQAGIKINQNFVEIYQKLGGDSNALMPGITFDSEGIVFEGNIDSFETRLVVESPTADRTVTIPNYTGELVIDSDTQTLKNKTLVDPNLIHPDLYDSENANYFIAFKPFSASLMSKNIDLTIPTLTDSDTLVTLTSTATLTNKHSLHQLLIHRQSVRLLMIQMVQRLLNYQQLHLLPMKLPLQMLLQLQVLLFLLLVLIPISI